MVFQNYALFPHMTVRQNIGFGLQMRGVPRGRDRRSASTRRSRWSSCSGQAHKLPGQLSGGQQQRVAIARAIVIEPPLVLMDEPLSNLDAKLRLEMRAEIRRIHHELGRATIYVTHDQDEALSLADRIVVLRDGVVRQIGTPRGALRAAGQPARRRFMGFRNLLELDVERERRRPRSRCAGRGIALHRRAQAAARRAARAPSRSARRRSSSATAERRQRDRRTVENVEYQRPRIRRLDVVTADGHDAARSRAGDASRSATPCALHVPADRALVYPARRERAMRRRSTSAAHRAARRAARRRDAAGRCRRLLFVLLLFVYPFLYGLRAVVRAEGRRLARQLSALLLRPLPVRHDRHDAAARAAGHADQRRRSRCRSPSGCGCSRATSGC